MDNACALTFPNEVKKIKILLSWKFFLPLKNSKFPQNFEIPRRFPKTPKFSPFGGEFPNSENTGTRVADVEKEGGGYKNFISPPRHSLLLGMVANFPMQFDKLKQVL